MSELDLALLRPEDVIATEVSDGVFAYIQPDGGWNLNNTGFIVGRQNVVAIDASSTERRTKALRASISQVSDKPVSILVNTHHHGDHTYGNYLFPEATIIAHENCRAEMLDMPRPDDITYFTDVEWGDIEIKLPTLTFSSSVNLFVDELICQVRHFGTPAHTTNDAVVWIPERRTLFSGDLIFNGGMPLLLMGSIAGSIETLTRIRDDLAPEVVVPGHGDICGPDVIDQMLGYLRFLSDFAAEAHEAGLSPLEAARECDLGEYSSLTDGERLAGNLHRAYSELRGEPRGVKIDERAAWDDMVAFNGGKPLTCYA